jgi:hypothetical protein
MSKDPAGRGDDDSRETGRVEDPDGLLELRKSNSVVARVSMFAQLEEDMKKAAKEAKATKLPKGTSNRSAARREHVSQAFTRFATQPVTVGEVQEAVRCAVSRDVSSTVTGTLSKVLVFTVAQFVDQLARSSFHIQTVPQRTESCPQLQRPNSRKKDSLVRSMMTIVFSEDKSRFEIQVLEPLVHMRGHGLQVCNAV